MSLPTKAPKHGPSIYHQLSHAGRRLAAQTGGEGRTAGPPRVGRHGAGDVVAALGLNLRSRRLVCRAREPERSGQRGREKCRRISGLFTHTISVSRQTSSRPRPRNFRKACTRQRLPSVQGSEDPGSRHCAEATASTPALFLVGRPKKRKQKKEECADCPCPVATACRGRGRGRSGSISRG